MGAHIVLISGKMGSGKTTTARAVVKALEEIGTKACVIKFADILYEMHDAVCKVANRYGIPTEKKEGILLQLLGTEWGRNTKGSNVWTDAAKERIRQLEFSDHEVILIEDCRFKNELSEFPGALTVRLECPETARKARCEGWRETTQHQSETDLDEASSSGQFHLKFTTNLTSVDDIVKIVIECLDTMTSERIHS